MDRQDASDLCGASACTASVVLCVTNLRSPPPPPPPLSFPPFSLCRVVHALSGPDRRRRLGEGFLPSPLLSGFLVLRPALISYVRVALSEFVWCMRGGDAVVAPFSVRVKCQTLPSPTTKKVAAVMRFALATPPPSSLASPCPLLSTIALRVYRSIYIYVSVTAATVAPVEVVGPRRAPPPSITLGLPLTFPPTAPFLPHHSVGAASSEHTRTSKWCAIGAVCATAGMRGVHDRACVQGPSLSSLISSPHRPFPPPPCMPTHPSWV